MRPAAAGTALLLLLAAALYAGFRIHRHLAGAQPHPTPTEIPSTCSPTSPAHTTQHPIVAFGDSITNGLGADRRCIPLRPATTAPAAHLEHAGDTTYVADLQRITGTTTLNYGYGGETTAEGRRRIAHILRTIRPRTVLIMEGTNDVLQGRPIGETITNLAAMVRAARAAGAHPILITTPALAPPQTDRTGPLNRSIEQLGKREKVRVIRLAHLPRHDLNPDGIHPNDRGYLAIARRVVSENSHKFGHRIVSGRL